MQQMSFYDLHVELIADMTTRHCSNYQIQIYYKDVTCLRNVT